MALKTVGPRLPLPRNTISDGVTVPNFEVVMFPQAETQHDLIVSSIRNILATRTGERPMSNFGMSIERLMFEPYTDDLAILGAEIIRDAVNNYEPRVRVVSISFVPDLNKECILWNIVLQENDNPTEPFRMQVRSQ
jgi:phage baseplate assembly protein W